MSQEIRTPLNCIIGMLTLLNDTTLTNEQRDYIDMLRECSINLMTIINDILDFSKLEADKVELNLTCQNIRKCIESANDILASKIYEKGIEYNFFIDSNVPDKIKIDSNRLKQVVLNILNNAIKFTDKGSIFLDIKVESFHTNVNINQDTNTNQDTNIILKFSITDTGCGIAQTDRLKLFESFSQIHSKMSNKFSEGTGLGLVISKKIIDLMNGHIWLDWSEVGKGSRFCFTINTSLCNNEESDIEPAIEDNNLLLNKKIFILDDNRENRLGLANLVHKWGMIPYTFSSALEALYMLKLKQTEFDIGLVDVCMPEMTGKEFAIKLKKQCEENKREQIPLIALSSLGDIQHDYSSYFKGQLIKPVKESKLKELCQNILAKSTSNNSNNIMQHSVYFDLDTDLKETINILLVEDVVINQRVVIRFLNKLGFNNIDIAYDGVKCLEMMTLKHYDIILLDIRMPIMNGEKVCEYIINYYQNNNYSNHHNYNHHNNNYNHHNNKVYMFKNLRKPYIIAVTAYCQKEDRNKYLNMGFNDYISKPINIIQLDKSMKLFMKTILSN